MTENSIEIPTGVASAEKKKVRGRGRGMIRQRSNENANFKEQLKLLDEKPNESSMNNETFLESPTRQRDLKVRKMKAGFEPYQVKKKHAMSQSNTEEKSNFASQKKQMLSPSRRKSPSSDKYHSEHLKYSPNHNKVRFRRNSSKSYSSIADQQHDKEQTYRQKERHSQQKNVCKGIKPEDDWDEETVDQKHNSVEINGKGEEIEKNFYNTEQTVSTGPLLVNNTEQVENTELQPADNIKQMSNNKMHLLNDAEQNESTKLLVVNNIEPIRDNEPIRNNEPHLVINIEQGDNKESKLVNSIEDEFKQVCLSESKDNLSNISTRTVKPSENILHDAKIKRKTQGIAILECPCSCNLSDDGLEGCSGYCDESRSREISPISIKNLETNNALERAADTDMIDDIFLVASSTMQSDEPLDFIVDSDSETFKDDESETQNSVLDRDIEPDESFTPKKISTEEINAMFKSPQKENNVPHSKQKAISISSGDSRSSNENIDEMYDFRTGLIESLQCEIDRKSPLSTCTSSSSESGASRKVSIDVENLADHGNLETLHSDNIVKTKSKEVYKQRSVMGSIRSILNENKGLDKNSKKEAHVIERKAQSYNKTKQSQQESIKTEKKPPNKLKQKHDQRRNKNTRCDKILSPPKNCNDESSKRSGGLIVLPDSDYIDKSAGKKEFPKHRQSCDPEYDRSLTNQNLTNREHSPKHVHFSQNGTALKSSKSLDKKQQISEYSKVIQDNQYHLKKLLQRGFQSIESINVMIQASETIQQNYGELIVLHQDYAFRYDYESALWKSAFHNIISQFRECLEDKQVPQSTIQEIGKQYWNFLQNSIQFLDSLTLQLQERIDFDLAVYLDDPIKMSTCSKQVKFALRSCHLMLIQIGDLERYVAQLQQEESYSKAQECYTQAQILAPKNGKTYNQQAVVAVVRKHKLDAVYYYTRSLQASNPILTAKDRLTAIFQEIRKKAGVLKQKQNIEDPYQNNPNNTKHHNQIDTYSKDSNADHLRDEVWIFYRNGHMFKVMLTEQNEVVDLIPNVSILNKQQLALDTVGKHDRLSLNKVNRGFIIHFLFVHCMLYTNIGLEQFNMLHQETLCDLITLLKYSKVSSVKKDNLLKYMAINIFSIHNILEKQEHEDVIPNTALDLALIFGMDMFAVLCKHCINLFHSSEDLSVADQYLPAIRIWLRWLAIHTSLVTKSTASSMYDIWSDCCELFNIMSDLDVNENLTMKSDDGENVYLGEDLLLAGFKPLPGSLLHCAPEEKDKDEARTQLRIENIVNLINKLNDCGNLPFAYDEKEKTYKAVQASQISVSPTKKPKTLDVEDELEASEEVIINNEEEEVFGDMSHVDELKAQKALLMKQLQENEEKRQEAIAVIEKHKAQGRHLSENSPSYLVADTNCYIDHLNLIVTILTSKYFTLIVPLIVINELDGLKKGSYYDESRHHDHQRKVQQNARIAVDFLDDQFSQHISNLRAITSSGSEMDTIVFRAEEFSTDRGTNDDVILSCCLKYCKEHITRTEGESNIVRRDVVLLTSDRNLRLKAHTRFVPTVDVVTFMKMAKFV